MTHSIKAQQTFNLDGRGRCELTNVGERATLSCKRRSLHVLENMGNEVVVHSFGLPKVYGEIGYNITCHVYDEQGHYLQSQLINPLGEAHLSTRNLPLGSLPVLCKIRRNSLAPEPTAEERSCCSLM